MNKILVANRGEIALSALRCIREMGLHSVAVFSQADENALHIRYADEIRLLPGGSAASNYGSPQCILEAIQTSGADAVYCGYGFLSESPEFAALCQQNSITLIGPEPEILERCRNKLQCFQKASFLGIPTPDHSEPLVSEADMYEKAQQLGYPVLLKPVAGTGGRHIHKAYRREDLHQSRLELQREYGQRDISTPYYLEQYVRRALHVEFPVLADRFGNVVQLGERECVIQRRFQKLISITPSVWLAPELRQKLAEAAVAITRGLGFVGCGSVEFMVDERGKWYFMEVNPRLQVEYALTEIAYGVELIKEQIRIAAGGRLALPADVDQPRFHAIECRINAEDPTRDFRPSTGTIREYYLPGGYGYSVLSSVQKGHPFNIYYDPMILKIDCFANTREGALAKVQFALDAARLKGIKTNIPFLRRIVGSEEFKANKLRCDFKIKDFLPTVTEDKKRQEIAALAAALDHEVLGRFRTPSFRRNVSEVNVWGMSGRMDLITRRSL